jgi:hypothetical protein
MNNKLERIWKEAVVSWSSQYSGICLEALNVLDGFDSIMLGMSKFIINALNPSG